MKKIFALIIAFVMVFGVVKQVVAVPILIGIGGFSGSETVLDLDSLPKDGSAVNTQFNGIGVDFPSTGGGWRTFPESSYFIPNGDPSNGIASTTLDSATVFIDFLSPVNRVGLDVGSNITLTVTIDTLLGGSPTGSFTFNQTHGPSNGFPNPVFRGFEDTAGIDSLRLSFSGGFHYIDNLRFETSGTPVPEPTTIALLGIGLAGLAGAAVRRRLKKTKQ